MNRPFSLGNSARPRVNSRTLARRWGQYFSLFAPNLRVRVLGFDARTNSSAVAALVPTHAAAYEEEEARGDIVMTTDLEAFNACVLDALALPGLARLGANRPASRMNSARPRVNSRA